MMNKRQVEKTDITAESANVKKRHLLVAFSDITAENSESANVKKRRQVENSDSDNPDHVSGCYLLAILKGKVASPELRTDVPIVSLGFFVKGSLVTQTGFCTDEPFFCDYVDEVKRDQPNIEVNVNSKYVTRYNCFVNHQGDKVVHTFS